MGRRKKKEFIGATRKQIVEYLNRYRDMEGPKRVGYWRYEVMPELIEQGESIKNPTVKIPTLFLPYLMKSLAPADFVYVLYLCMRFKQGYARVKLDDIVKYSGVSKQKLSDAQVRLKKLGLIERIVTTGYHDFGSKIMIPDFRG